MKQIILVSLLLLVAVFALPFVSQPTEALLDIGHAVVLPDPGPVATPSATASPTAIPTVAPTTANNSTPTTLDENAVVVTVSVAGAVQSLPLETYVWGVLAGEMPPTFPLEALKAQAVAARTLACHTIARGMPEKHPDALLCDQPDHCQAYLPRDTAFKKWGDAAATYATALDTAVQETLREVLLYNGEPILAVFSSTSSGQTERAADVWGKDVPYLQSVISPGEENSPHYQDHVSLDAAEFWRILKKAYPDAVAGKTPFGRIERSPSGGVISIEVGGALVSGTTMRGLFGLRSTNFTVVLTGDRVLFDTKGYGHGVGLSQYGARSMALAGKSYADILAWYYKDTLLSVYEGV